MNRSVADGDAAGAEVRVDVLGQLRIACGGRTVTALEPRRRNLAILILLGVEREMDRDRLASYVWADKEPRKARQSLSETLYELRKHLGEGWLESSGATLRVTSSLTVDANDFRDAVARGAATDAMSLYRGHFLRGFNLNVPDFEHWVEGQDRELFALYRNMADRAIMKARNDDDFEMARGIAHGWVELRADDDEAQHYLIALTALCGDRSAALRQYDAYCRILSGLELSPLDRTQALAAAVRDADPAAIRSMVRLSPDEEPLTERPTQLWFKSNASGPTMVFIRDPRDVEGRAVPISRRRTTIGPSGDLPVGQTGDAAILATLTRSDAVGRVVLSPHEKSREVYTLISGPRVLRVGDAFRVGQQLFVLERIDD